ncbi:flippase [Candidatus Saccharibacteria bacterium]|nr:flippase [Candidatus Saccharibacteria bacterium]
MTNTKKNFVYNTIYQLFSIIVPIILAPFLSRRLGVGGSGIYSYTYSVVYYFTLFTLLGINNYGSRLVAKVREDKKEVSKVFWELASLQLTLGTIMVSLFLIMTFTVFDKYRIIYLIQGLFIFSAALDINWFFYGMEEFKLTVIRSLIIKVINFICILIFVKSPDDVWVYALIMSTSALANQIVLWPFMRTRVIFVRPTIKNMKKHIKPLLVLFIPVIAISIYKIMDKIMIGIISNVNEVGLYEYGEKINSIPLTIIAALGTVMLPKISNLAAKKKRTEIRQYLNKSISFVLFISTPLFYLFAISLNIIVPMYLGNDFSPTSSLTMLLSISLPFVSFANVIRTQYLIPMEKDRIYVTSVVIGAVLNFIVNMLMIPSLGAKGACYGTIIAEISVMVFQTLCIKNEIQLTNNIKTFIIFALKSAAAFAPSLILGNFIEDGLKKVFLQLLVYASTYTILNIEYINKNIIRINTTRKHAQ